MASQVQKSPSAFSVLFRNRNFAVIWLGEFVSQFGNGLVSIASSILVFRVTHSALSVGLMLMMTALPGFFLGLVAGVFVDRMDRKRIMIVCEILRALLFFLIPVLLPYGIGWLYLLVLLSSAVGQFFEPAYASILPDITTSEELASANSLLSISSVGAQGLGYALAGLITSRFSAEAAYYLNAVTFIFSAASLLLISVPFIKVETKTTVRVVVQDLKAGMRFLWDSPPLRSLLLVVFIPVLLLIGFSNSLMLPFANRVLNATDFEYGLIEGVALVGFVLGGIAMAKYADRLREGQWLAISHIGMGITTMLFAEARAVWVAIVLNAIVLFINVPSFIGRQLVIQRNTTREMRGRVFSAFGVTRDLSFIVGMGLVAIGDAVDVKLLMFLSGTGLAICGLLVLVIPGLRRSSAEWRQAITFLRGVPEAPGLSIGRPVTLDDFKAYTSDIPLLSLMSMKDYQHLMPEVTYYDASPGTVIVRAGENSDAAYFVVDGQVVAGRVEDDEERVLEILNKGEFFGEIAALTGVPRTANVVASQDTKLLRIPATTLRMIGSRPELNRLVYSKMTERMLRMNLIRFAG